MPIFTSIDFYGTPDDSKISCLFVSLQDQKHLGKESLHVYKEVKTCHPRNRILCNSKITLHQNFTTFLCLMGLQNTVNKWLSWFITRRIIIKKDPTQSHYSSFLNTREECASNAERSRMVLSQEMAKLAGYFRSQCFPLNMYIAAVALRAPRNVKL